MERSVTAKRVTFIRRVGWLSVASMLALALLAPTANAASVEPTDPGSGNPTCTDLNPAWTLSFKIDTGDLEERTYEWNEGAPVASNWTGQAITLSNLSGDGQTFDWSSTLAVSGVLVKAASDNHALYTYVPPVTSDTELTHGGGQQAISHLLFCGDPSTTTTTTTTETTTTETTTTETTTTETTTTETTTTETTTTETTTTETTTPSQSVLAETGTPSVTLPPTDSISGTSAPSDGTWRLALIALAALLASVLVMTPALATSRRR